MKHLAFLLALIGGFVQVARAEEFDFDRQQYFEWVGAPSNQISYTSIDSDFEDAIAKAFDSIDREGSKWKIRRIVEYAFYRAFPVPHGDIQVSQRPTSTEHLPTSGAYFFQSQVDPSVKFVAILGRNYSYLYSKASEEARAQAASFVKLVEEEIFLRSFFKGGVMQFKENGRLGFFPDIEKQNYDWTSLILSDNEKTKLINTIDSFLKGYDYVTWKKLGLPLSRGVLLDGPPGTGKSMVAKIIMSQDIKGYYGKNWTYFHVQARHITSVDAIRKIYNTARSLNPSIVFIEDIDLIAGTDRTSRQAVKNELMQQLDGLEKLEGVITIGTTNFGNKIDPALRRAGRLGFHQTIGLPDYQERMELFKLFSKKANYNDLQFENYATATEQMPGSDIKEIVRLAFESAIKGRSIGEDQKVVLRDVDFRAAFQTKARASRTHALTMEK